MIILLDKKTILKEKIINLIWKCQKNKKIGKIETVLTYIIGISIFLLILSLIILIFGIFLRIKSVGSFSFYFICFGFFSLLVFSLWIWAIYSYNNVLLEKGEEYSYQSTEREFLNLFICGIILILVFLLLIGIC